MLSGWGLHYESGSKEMPVEPEVKHIPYPDFKIKPFRQPKSSRDEEDIKICLKCRRRRCIFESQNKGKKKARK